jgi:sulfite exporter TauE/SafE
VTVAVAGLLLGVTGSLHCVAMCGPFVLLAQGAGRQRPRAALAASLWHHTGRVLIYGALGLAAGSTAHILVDARARNVVTVALGIVIALGAALTLFERRVQSTRRWTIAITAVIASAGRHLDRRRWYGRVALGALNGLLPCGLLYVALAAASACGGAASGAMFMLAFGLGTAPALAVVAITRLPARSRPILQRASPIAAGVVGLLLVGRGFGMVLPMPDLGPVGHVHQHSMSDR